MKPTITRIRHINLLIENPVYGTMYRNVLLPLLHGNVVVKNRTTIETFYKDQTYIIRTDIPFVDPRYVLKDNTVELCIDKINSVCADLLIKVGLWETAGINIFKDLTDTNDLTLALSLTNTFRKQGLAVAGVKVTRDGEEVMEYRVAADFGNHKFVTSNTDEMFIFLGTLAGTFTTSYDRRRNQQPDPNWYKGLDKADLQF